MLLFLPIRRHALAFRHCSSLARFFCAASSSSSSLSVSSSPLASSSPTSSTPNPHQSLRRDRVELCDVGWALHHGLSTAKDVPRAVENYRQSAEMGYSPAASLLADVYFFGSLPDGRDYEKARFWYQKVLDMTDPADQADAYVRCKALQKLGTVVHRLQGPHASRTHFTESIRVCSEHLGGNWAFHLPHDPPGLWQHLQAETAALSALATAKNLNGFVTFPRSKSFSPTSPSVLQLQAFTKALRTAEATDSSWALEQQEESLARFPSGNGAGDYGVTFLPSFFRVIGHPAVQSALRSVSPSVPPKFVVLGSALGAACVWPSLAFGFRSTGFDILDCHVSLARGLLQQLIAVDVGGDQAPEGPSSMATVPAPDLDSLQQLVKFERLDVVEDLKAGLLDGTEGKSRVLAEVREATVVWSNDYSWSEHDKLGTHYLLPSGILLYYLVLQYTLLLLYY